MESYNLKTASAYLNNLLLARGLLRNGTPIEFAHPSRGEGGKDATMASIINLVHDLVLRRDKEQEQQATLAQTIRNLRTDTTRNTVQLERTQTRNDDLARQLSLAQSQERTAKAAMRTAESSARALREEMARLKTTVAQVRASCANDVRKRDLQIQKLKTHLTAQQRGNKTGLVGASITITPGITGPVKSNGSGKDNAGLDVDDPEYSLKQETTEFLTQLSQSLSDENDNLIGLVRSTIATLREIQGLPENVHVAGAQGGDQDSHDVKGNMLHALTTSYDALALDMDHVLDHLRSLLTNPNFVPIEEVEAREEEIGRLREGWEMMEVRWKEAIMMMDTWRKRMLSGGDTVNLEELKRGLDLGVGLQGMEDATTATDDHDLGDSIAEEEVLDDAPESSELEELPNVSDDDLPEDEHVVSSHGRPGSSDKDSGIDIFDIKLPQKDQALKQSNGNAIAKSPRKVTFNSPKPQTPSLLADENVSELDASIPKSQRSRRLPSSTLRSGGSVKVLSSQEPKSLKRHSDIHPEQRSPKLTVQDKLNLAQAEADAVASSANVDAEPVPSQNPNDAVMSRKGSPIKTKVRGRPKRRKSTLSPEELEMLLGVNDDTETF